MDDGDNFDSVDFMNSPDPGAGSSTSRLLILQQRSDVSVHADDSIREDLSPLSRGAADHPSGEPDSHGEHSLFLEGRRLFSSVLSACYICKGSRQQCMYLAFSSNLDRSLKTECSSCMAVELEKALATPFKKWE